MDEIKIKKIVSQIGLYCVNEINIQDCIMTINYNFQNLQSQEQKIFLDLLAIEFKKRKKIFRKYSKKEKNLKKSQWKSLFSHLDYLNSQIKDDDIKEETDKISIEEIMESVNFNNDYFAKLSDYVSFLQNESEMRTFLTKKIKTLPKKQVQPFLESYLKYNILKKKANSLKNEKYIQIENILSNIYFSYLKEKIERQDMLKIEAYYVFEQLEFLNVDDQVYFLEKYKEFKEKQIKLFEEKSIFSKPKVKKNLAVAIRKANNVIDEINQIQKDREDFIKNHYLRLDISDEILDLIDKNYLVETKDILRKIENTNDKDRIKNLIYLKDIYTFIVEEAGKNDLPYVKKIYDYVQKVIALETREKKVKKNKQFEDNTVSSNITQEIDLESVLKKKKVYSFSKLKEILYLSDDDLILRLLTILDKEIENFSLDDDSIKKRLIMNIIQYLNNNSDKMNLEDRKEILRKIYIIKNNLHKKIIKENNHVDTRKKAYNYDFLKEIYKIIEYIILNYQFEGEIRKEHLRGHQKEDEDLYHLSMQVIFGQNDFSYVLALMNQFPTIFIIKENNESLFNKVFSAYLKSIRKKNLQEILYFEKILESFLDNEFYELDSFDLLYNINRLKDFEDENLDSEYNSHITEMMKSLEYKSSKKKKTLEQLCLKYHIQKDFSSKVFDEIKCFKKNLYDRFDLTDCKIVTIDDPRTKNFENAISIQKMSNEHICLGIYIIDTSFYINENTALDEDAKRRGFDNSQMHLFPKDLLSTELNLSEGEERPVQAYLFELTENLDVVNFEIKDAVIKVNKNYFFHEVKDIINNKNKDYEYLEFIRELSLKLQRKRNVNPKDNNFDRSVISEYTIFLNSFLATLAKKYEIPILYRNNYVEKAKKILKNLRDTYGDDPRFDEIITAFSQINEPSLYDIQSLGHNGLQIEDYTEVTRPNRSYVSLYNQRMLKKYFNKSVDLEERKHDFEVSSDLCSYLNQQKKWNLAFENELSYVKKLDRKST